jgi:nitroreductase
MADEPELFEIIHTTRSMRRLKPDPVPDALIRRILEAGTAAPSGGNMQRWRFLVVMDPAVKQRVGAFYKRAWDERVAPGYRANAPRRGSAASVLRTCLTPRNTSPTTSTKRRCGSWPAWQAPAAPTPVSGSSIYPAVQNMLLAARALGLGATLTTLYLNFAAEVEAILGLPPDAHSYALLPIGDPVGRFGPVGRAPLDDIVYQDRWGAPYPIP